MCHHIGFKYKFSSKVFVLTLVIFSSLIVRSKGGLLSASLHHKSYNVVNRLSDDFDETRVEIGEEGTLNSPPLGTSYVDCGSIAHIKNLRVNSCNSAKKRDPKGRVSSSICEIKRGSNVTFNLSFIPPSNSTQLKAVIHGIVDFVPIPLPCPQPDACHNSGITCPIYEGEAYDYTLQTTIKESYPRMKLWVKGQLLEENGQNMICIKIHVHIV